MDLVTGSFDTVLAIRELARRVEDLESRLAAMDAAGRPSATMDAGGKGGTMGPSTNGGTNKRKGKGKGEGEGDASAALSMTGGNDE